MGAKWMLPDCFDRSSIAQMSEKINAVAEWSNVIPKGRKMVRDGDLGAIDPQVQARVLTPDRLSPPATVDHEYLRAILTELQATNELLAALIAQGEPPVTLTPDAVELKEPKKRKG